MKSLRPNLAGKDCLSHASHFTCTLWNYFAVACAISTFVLSAPIQTQATNCVSAPSDLVSWWRAEGDAEDAVGGNDGTLYQGTTFGPGLVGSAFSFDGVDDCVTNALPGLTNLQDSFTMEFWAYPTASRAATPEATSGITGNGGQRYAIYPNYGGLGPVGAGVSVGTNGVSVFEHGYAYLASPLVYNAPLLGWTHVAVVYENRQPKLYLNGVLAWTGLTSTRAPYPSTWLGENGAQSGDYGYYAGLLDEISIYSRPLSAAEVQSIYAAGSAGKCPMVSNAPPTIVTQPQDHTADAGSAATFTVSVTGTWPFGCQWFFNSAPINGATSVALSLNDIQPAQAGLYSVVVTNAYGAVTSSNATLTVITHAPTITRHPQNVMAYQGEAVAFSSMAAGTAPLAYQWFFKGDALPGKTTTALALNNVQFSDAGNYWLVATNAYGSAVSSNAQLTVLPPPVCVSVPTGAIAWWRAESNTLDSIGPSDALFVGPAYGGFYQTGKVGTAFRPSSPGYLYVPASQDLDVGAGDGFTVEGWILPSTLSYSSPIIYWGNADITFLLRSPGTLETRLYATNTGVPRSITLRSTNQVLQVGTWQHVGLSFDKASGLIALFVNGVSVAQTNVVNFRPQTQSPVYLGSGGLGSPYFAGALDEFTIYNRALSTAEIQAIVAADEAGKCVPPPPVCVPPLTSLVAWWRGESNVLDSVSDNHGVVTPTILFTNGVAGKAFQFNGGYVRVPASDALDVGAGEGFTVEAWVNRGNTTSGQPLVQWSGGAGAPGVSLATISSPRLQANVVDAQGGAHYITTPVNSLIGGFQHVALTYDKASGVAAIYVRGNLVTQTNLGSFTPQTAYDLYLGYQPSPPVRFTGVMDEVSLYGRALSAAEIRAIALAHDAGKCFEPPAIIGQPENIEVGEGDTATFSVAATGTPLLRYQWQFAAANLSGATQSTLVLTNVQPDQAGLYSVTIANAAGSITSSNATLIVGPQRAAVRILSTAAAATETVVVPVVLVANGNENALGFSLNFNPAHLTYNGMVLGSGASDGSLLLNTSQVGNGSLGVGVALTPGMAFAAGTQEVVQVSFTAVALANHTTALITFGDLPMARQLSDVFYQPLPATYGSGSVAIAAVDYEGDVSPRPAGDRSTTITDWVLAGRYAARLDYPTNASEFQRADSAPRATLGDGAIKITDWVQAGRYAVGLDSLTPVGGPTSEIAGAAPRVPRGPASQLRVSDEVFVQGHRGTVSVILEAQGTEAAAGFSLCFDPDRLTFVSAALGSGAAGAVLNVNTSQIATGKLGVGLMLPAGTSFAVGSREILKATFATTAGATGNCAVTFCDFPVPREVSDVAADPLAAGYVSSAVAINPPPSLMIGKAGVDVTLSWPGWATDFVLQSAGDASIAAGGWTNVTVSPTVGDGENSVTLPRTGNATFYRLYRP